jgi:hypothetical protein
MSRLALGPIQSPIQQVPGSFTGMRWQEPYIDQTPLSSSKGKNRWSYASTLPMPSWHELSKSARSLGPCLLCTSPAVCHSIQGRSLYIPLLSYSSSVMLQALNAWQSLLYWGLKRSPMDCGEKGLRGFLYSAVCCYAPNTWSRSAQSFMCRGQLRQNVFLIRGTWNSVHNMKNDLSMSTLIITNCRVILRSSKLCTLYQISFGWSNQ